MKFRKWYWVLLVVVLVDLLFSFQTIACTDGIFCEDPKCPNNKTVAFLLSRPLDLYCPNDVLLRIAAFCGGAGRNRLGKTCKRLFRLASINNPMFFCHSWIDISKQDREELLKKICINGCYPSIQVNVDPEEAMLTIIPNLLYREPELDLASCEQALKRAIKNNHAKVVNALLESSILSKSALFNVDNLTMSPLFRAIKSKNPNMLQILLSKKGVIVDQNKKLGATPLYIAAQEGDFDAVKLLVEHGASIEFQFKEGYSPLYIASQKGHANIVAYLLDRGANPNAGEISTPLYVAAQEGKLPVIKLLVEYKGSIEARYHGFTPLYVAARNGYDDVVAYLIKIRANPKEYSENENDMSSPLYIAAQNGHAKVVKLLLDEGIKSDHHDFMGYSALYIAAQNGHSKTVELLRFSPLINSLAPNGSTTIYVASQNGHHEVVKFLIEALADTNIPFGNGYRPLYVAAQKGHFQVVEVLLQNGANVNATTDRDATPLYVAAQKGFLEIGKLLIQYRADLNKPFQNGFTPLHIAISENNREVAQMLIDSGADTSIKDRQGRIPNDLAQKDSF